MTTYSVTVRLTVVGPDRAAHFERVVDRYGSLERQHDDLLDCGWGFSDLDSTSEVDIAITVREDDERAAWGIATSSIRTAIHAAGGFTPSWDEHTAPTVDAVAYRLSDEGVSVLR